MKARTRALLTVGAVAAVVALIVFGLAGNGSGGGGQRAAALPSQQLAGPPVTLAALRGRPALVTFWASWCTPCQKEAAALERFAQTPAGRGRLVGVNWSDTLSGARSFIRTNRWSFSNVRDGAGTVGDAYGLTGLPTTFVLDARGRIRQALRGPQSEQTLARALASVRPVGSGAAGT
jgi:cytochrome c biogenesis protein CcmG, thiol:disulfide interchange protein DsbE